MSQQLIALPLKPGDPKLNELIAYLSDTFTYAVQTRQQQMDGKYTRWMNNYSGKPQEAVRSTPFPNASNFMPQLIRMHTDILAARVIGIVFGTKPFWRPTTFIEAPHEWTQQLGAWLEYESFYNIGLYEPVDSGIFRAFKTGTSVLKAPWIENEVWLGGMASDGTGFEGKPLRTEGIELRPLAFDDFYPYPVTANNLKEVKIKFHKLRFSKDEVEMRVARGWWDRKAGEALMTSGDENETGQARLVQAQEAGIDLQPQVTRPFKAIEAWLDYTIANDGRQYRIVVVFDPRRRTSDGYLKGYFNPSSRGLDPFVDLRPMPREELFFGYCVPEILEQSQEEQAQIHNWRRDANVIANTPGWKKKKYADVPNPASNWYPGKVWELEAMDDLEIVQFAGNYNSLIEEEMFLMNWVERLTGSGPPQQGFGQGTMDGKRGVYTSQGTMALLSEGNKRLDIYIKRLRYSFHRLGDIIYSSNRDWRPDGAEFTVWGQNGQAVRETFKFKEPEGYRGLFFEIGASEASANKEVDRSNYLLMANVMAGYYRQVTETAGIATQLPPDHPMRESMLMVLDGAKDLADRILFLFDIGDRSRLLPDIRTVLGGSPQQADDAAIAAGLPPTEGSVGRSELEALSGYIGSIQASMPR